MKGSKIRSVYLGCVNTYLGFGPSEEPVRYFNEIYFDLGDYWANVFAGIDDSQAAVSIEKRDMNLLVQCAPHYVGHRQRPNPTSPIAVAI